MTFLGAPARRLSLRAHFGTDKHPDALGNLYFGLFLGDPFLGGIEPDNGVGGYARASVTNDLVLWGTVAPGQVEITTLTDIVWPAAIGPWSVITTLTHWGVFDVPKADGGTLWYADVIGSGGFVVTAVGAQPRILAGGITILQGADGTAPGYTSYASLGSSHVHPYPAGLQVGDLLVDTVTDRYALATPAGWTAVSDSSYSNQWSALWWKIATAADVAAGSLAFTATATYDLSVLAAFVKGSFNPAIPLPGFVKITSTAPAVTVDTVAVQNGSSVISFAGVVFAGGQPGFVTASNGGQVVKRQLNNYAVSLAVDTPPITTLLGQAWQSSVSTTSGHYLSYAVSTAVGTAVVPSMTSRSAFLTSVFATAPVRPLPGALLFNITPTLQVLADGTPSPFSVQFQVSSRSDFLTGPTMLQTTQLDGQTKGGVQIQVTAAMPKSVPIYWRSRAGAPLHPGDAPTWGPWCTTQSFVFALESTTGGEYLSENIGITLPPWSDSLEVMTENVGVGFPTVFFETLEEITENVGVAVTQSQEALEELIMNVGFQAIDNRIWGEYLTEGSVSVNMPPPHIWFAWRPVGFAGDHVYLYGQGFGDALRDHHVHAFTNDPMVAYPLNTPIPPDRELTVFHVELDVATLHAYDATRRISSGTLVATPYSDPEAGIIEVVIPAEMAPALDVVLGQRVTFYVITDGGTSNRIDWLMYPTLPTAVTPIGSVIQENAGVRVSADPTGPGGIPQRHARFDVDYVVESGLPQRPALLSTTSRTSATLGAGTGSQALEEAYSAVTGATARWIPNPTTLVARPDLGTGISLWVPAQGGGASWRLTDGTAPYLDPGYLATTRTGPVVRDALVLDGSSWLEFDTAVGTSYGFLLVANLHPSPAAGNSSILCSFADGAAPAGTSPVGVTLNGSVVASYCGIDRVAPFKRPIVNMVGKTVMIGLSVSPTSLTLTVVDETLTTSTISHVPLHPSSRFWLGRDARLGADQRRASFDILDLSWWNTEVDPAAMQNAINALDSVYGVLRR